MSVYLMHGDKGGVGKSFLASVFLEWLIAGKKSVALVECDMRNGDVSRVFAEADVPVHAVDLRVDEGWIELLSVLDESEATDVIVSLPANIGSDVSSHAEDFLTGMKGLKRSVCVFWPANRSADSVGLLRPAMDAFLARAKAFVFCKNLFFGAPAKFRRWNESQTRVDFLEGGGIEIDLEELHEAVVDATFLAHPARRFASADGLRYGERLTLSAWRDRTFATFDEIAPAIGAGKR